MLKLVFVDYKVDHPDVSCIQMDSRETLLDADVVLIDPAGLLKYCGKTVPFHDGSNRFVSVNGSDWGRQLFNRRRREFQTLLGSGKIVLTFLSPVYSVLGEINGSSEYALITNYDWCPARSIITKLLSPGTGSAISLKSPKHLFAPYFKAFADRISYEAYLETTSEYNDTIFLINKAGNAVGFSLPTENGVLVFLPYPGDRVDANKLMGVLAQCAKPFLTKDFRTPEPEWCRTFPIPGEAEKIVELGELQSRIEELNKSGDVVQEQIRQLQHFRGLLYEQGKPLEEIVLRSFRLMGFEAERFQENDMEHDVVLKSVEGTILGEVEGKDNDAIHIDKLDQLSRVIDEHFEKNGVYPEGVLIGNGYRFTPVENRQDSFTEKVHIAAERKRLGLLSTVELFKAVVRMLQDPTNADLKAKFRAAMFDANGKAIVF